MSNHESTEGGRDRVTALEPEGERPRAEFPTTQWKVVLEAGAGPRTSSAMNDLCAAYWKPLYAYLRRSDVTASDAEDLVQGFLAALVERQDLARVGPEKGRFRTYLLTSMRNFLLKEVERKRTAKRGGQHRFVSLKEAQSESEWAADLTAPTPEIAYDRRWARTVLDRALASLRVEQTLRGRVALFDVMVPFLDGAEPAAYLRVAEQWGVSPNHFAVQVHRLRLRLRELVRAEVASTVQHAADIPAEMRHLFEAWRD